MFWLLSVWFGIAEFSAGHLAPVKIVYYRNTNHIQHLTPNLECVNPVFLLNFLHPQAAQDESRTNIQAVVGASVVGLVKSNNSITNGSANCSQQATKSNSFLWRSRCKGPWTTSARGLCAGATVAPEGRFICCWTAMEFKMEVEWNLALVQFYSLQVSQHYHSNSSITTQSFFFFF